ncbi:60s ribosomal protein l7 [Lentinula detonsa]|uniref:60s ribosomal protein l7 n=1 Tax=Lentinula detonsa TaxID=2804962 RepID=A0AA38PZG2_9AGAR|nr:60s ribosomal protein l7 [Lentinula detonsa]
MPLIRPTRFGRPPQIRKPLPFDSRRKLPRPPTNLQIREISPCRLSDHYHSTLSDNLMYMSYSHKTNPIPSHQREIRLRWDPSNPYSKYRKNPPVGGSQWSKIPSPPITPSTIPKLLSIQLHIMSKDALISRSNLLGVIAALRALSGESSSLSSKSINGVEIIRGKKQVGGWIRQGMPAGAKVTLKGPPMYDLISTLSEFVLPRLRDFNGFPIPPTTSSHTSYLPSSANAVKPSDVTGVVSFGLPPAAMAFWPQIEVNQDAYPKMYGMHVHFITDAVGLGAQERARALVSGFQIPFVRMS